MAVLGKRLALCRRQLAIGVLATAACLAMLNMPQVVYFNTTASLPRGIYVAIPGEAYRVGDYVVYKITDEVEQLVEERGWRSPSAPKGVPFLKQIGALPGGTYGTDQDNNFFVNQKYRGKVITTDKCGIPMPVEYGLQRVKEREFLPLTPADRSLDGRYTGTVPLKNIQTRVIPVLVEY